MTGKADNQPDSFTLLEVCFWPTAARCVARQLLARAVVKSGRPIEILIVSDVRHLLEQVSQSVLSNRQTATDKRQ